MIAAPAAPGACAGLSGKGRGLGWKVQLILLSSGMSLGHGKKIWQTSPPLEFGVREVQEKRDKKPK